MTFVTDHSLKVFCVAHDAMAQLGLLDVTPNSGVGKSAWLSSRDFCHIHD